MNSVRKMFTYIFNREPLKIWFYRELDFINFGDELTSDIIERLFHQKWTRTEINDADLVAVGSIIEVVDQPRPKKCYVWGSGFIREGEATINPYLEFRAVRGLKSLNRIPSRFRDIPLGDPGLLSNLIYKPASKKTCKIGIIPHYVDEDMGLLERAKKDSINYSVISVKNSPEVVVEQLTECKVILSSSLHGLIIADSFGIPNIHMPLSEGLTGGDYKFRDYYSAFEKQYAYFDKSDLYDLDEIERIIENYRPIESLSRIQADLIESFPFK